MKSVTITSGGMDSVTLAYYLAAGGYEQHCLSFDYGQRHVRELACAAEIASTLGCKHSVISLLSFGKMLRGSSLTDNVPVPEGHYSQENMKTTVVPNRNAVMLSLAWGVAVAEHARKVSYGAHIGDRAQYPDCRQEFVDALEKALLLGTEGFGDPLLSLSSPFVKITKAEIVKLGTELSVPYQHTWSCYCGEGRACGRCGTCVERLEAFYLNDLVDPLEYEDREYWKQAIAEFNSKQ